MTSTMFRIMRENADQLAGRFPWACENYGAFYILSLKHVCGLSPPFITCKVLTWLPSLETVIRRLRELG